jgi:hypothetical protein
MRITVMKNMAKSPKWGQDLMEESEGEKPPLSARVSGELDRMKWFLWHGNVVRALESIDELEDLVAAREPTDVYVQLSRVVRFLSAIKCLLMKIRHSSAARQQLRTWLRRRR